MNAQNPSWYEIVYNSAILAQIEGNLCFDKECLTHGKIMSKQNKKKINKR